MWYPFVSKIEEQLYEVHSLSNEVRTVRSSTDKHQEPDKEGSKIDDYVYDYEAEDDISHGVLPASRDNKELAIEFLSHFIHFGSKCSGLLLFF